MKTVSIHEITQEVKLTSFEDTAMFLNLFYPSMVEEILECFTDFTDFDIIAELVDTLNLKIIAVVEQSPQQGMILHGYINQEVAA